MKPVVEEFPFPWPLSEAQELHAALCEIYPTSKGATFVAVRAGLSPAMLNTDQASYLLWKEILDAGATARKNREVVKIARDQNPTNPRRPFFDALLAPAAGTIPRDGQPRGADGAPAFLRANDDVTEPEALLFQDDLTLAIGKVPWLILVLQQLQTLGPAVCRLQAAWQAGTQRGTGFRIAPDLLLTNWHVFHYEGLKASAVTAEFGYDDDGQGGGLASSALQCDVATIRGQEADDWAIIEVQALANSIPIVKLSEAVDPAINAPAFIIQHPGGERKRVAYVRNQITEFDDRIVHYLSDTQTGSSGSPVFNENGRLIALHHAGGRPQEVAGKSPVRKNEGIRIPRILNGLTQIGIRVP